MKIAVIISSSISSFGFIGTVVHNAVWLNSLSGIFSFLTLALTLYSKEENIAEIAQRHKKTADELWIIRDDYISLLTDYDELEISEIKEQRHILQERLSAIYKKEPRTNYTAYNKARKFLKKNEGQFFKAEEIDQLLPEHLRTNNNEGNI